MTNADRIRAMTDEELAGVVTCPHIYCPYSDDKYESEIRSCNVCIRNWLKREIPAPPQKKPLCDDCKHAVDGVVDDFAAVFCAARHGYFGQVAECKDYAPKEVSDNG